MADEKKIAEEKLAAEKEKIESFTDFGNMYNFKKDFKYAYKTNAGLTPDIVRDAGFPPQVIGFIL